MRQDACMAIMLKHLDDVLRKTLVPAMQREALESLAYGHPLGRWVEPDRYPDWEAARRLHTEFPSVTRSPFDGVDWNMLVAPEITVGERIERAQRERDEALADVDAERDRVLELYREKVADAPHGERFFW